MELYKQDFDKQKERYLERLGEPDKSKKGGVDEAMWPLLDVINTRKHFYTTSSCAGRINFFVNAADKRKDKAQWLYVTHNTITDEECVQAINKLSKEEIQEVVWFRLESAIIHIVARTLEDAEWLLQQARHCGFKHAGILASKKRIVVEIIDSNRMDIPIAEKGVLIVSEEYIQRVAQLANEKLLETRKKMEQLRQEIKKDNLKEEISIQSD